MSNQVAVTAMQFAFSHRRPRTHAREHSAVEVRQRFEVGTPFTGHDRPEDAIDDQSKADASERSDMLLDAGIPSSRYIHTGTTAPWQINSTAFPIHCRPTNHQHTRKETLGVQTDIFRQNLQVTVCLREESSRKSISIALCMHVCECWFLVCVCRGNGDNHTM